MSVLAKRCLSAALCCLVVALAAGCTRPNNPDRYDRSKAMTSAPTYRGIVLSVRQVEVTGQEKGSNIAGNIAGGAAGGVAGSTIGGGRGGMLAAIAGVVGGAILADRAQDIATAHVAFEYIVEVEAPVYRREGDVGGTQANLTGTFEKVLRTVIQKDEKPFAIGSRVFLIDNKEDPRVIPDGTAQPQPKVDLSQ